MSGPAPASRHTRRMDHIVDLDAVALAIRPMLDDLVDTQVGPITWRDELAPWPQPITSDRSSVGYPESLGLSLRRGDDEAEFIAWTGGWADQAIFVAGHIVNSGPEFASVDERVDAVRAFIKDWELALGAEART